jgi:hypothetical protein
LHYVLKNNSVIEEYDKRGELKASKIVFPGYEIVEDSEKHKYTYDHYGNWTEIKTFDDFVELGMGRPSGLIQITRPYIERRFTYCE